MEDVRPRLSPSQVSMKTVLTVAFTLVGLFLLGWLVVRMQTALVLILIAALLAVALQHFVDLLTRRGASRGMAITAAMLGVLAVVGGMVFLLVPPAAQQVGAFVEAAPRYLDELRGSHFYEGLNAHFGLDQRLGHLSTTLSAHIQNFANIAISAVTGILSLLGAAVTVFFLIIFMLAFGRELIQRWLAEAVPQRRGQYEKLIRQTYHSIGGYIGGLMVIVLVNAAATTAFLAIIGNPFFLPLGILSGLGSLVPLVGNTVAGVLISLVSWATSGLWRGIATAVYYVLYQQFENHVLGPIVYKRTVNLNPLVVVLSLLCFAELAGILGAVLAIPLVTIGKIILRETLLIRRDKLGLPQREPAGSRAR